MTELVTLPNCRHNIVTNTLLFEVATKMDFYSSRYLSLVRMGDEFRCVPKLRGNLEPKLNRLKNLGKL